MLIITVKHLGPLNDDAGYPRTFPNREQAEAEISLIDLAGWAKKEDCEIEEIQ